MGCVQSSSKATTSPQRHNEASASQPVHNTLTEADRQELAQVITEATALKKQIRRLALTNKPAVDLGISVMELMGEINSELENPSAIDRQSFRNRLEAMKTQAQELS